MRDTKVHWNNTYSDKGDNVSWYQDNPSLSLRLIRAAASASHVPIIDLGAGASRLADNLLNNGYSDVTLLDISKIALARTRARLGSSAAKISWIIADVTQWQPSRVYAVWHDRAVFHFLTDVAAQDAYIVALKRGTATGSSVILSTFALTGPERCSGLQVQKYSAATLAARLGKEFVLYTEVTEQHRTPFGTIQDFIYAGFHRR